MSDRPQTSWIALSAFIVGGWLTNALHGPLSHIDIATERGEVATASACGHSHGDNASDAPSAPADGHHDCPVCDHLAMPAVAAAFVELPVVSEGLCEVVVPDASAPEVAFLRTHLSRGPPADAA